MWKTSKKKKNVKIAFTDNKDVQEMATNLKLLNDVEIVDYKVTGLNNFSVTFTRKFIDYFNNNQDRLQLASMQNMIGAVRTFPEEISTNKDIRTEQFSTMFFSTIVLSYLNETKLIRKLEQDNLDQLAELIITTESIRNMMIEA